MKMLSIFEAVLALSLIPFGVARTQTNTPATDLELRIQPDSVHKQIPQSFEVVILNKSSHEVRLPMPSLNCGDVPHGTVSLRFKLKYSNSAGSALGSGCFKDFGYQPILDRLKEWKVLRPGESLSLMNNLVLTTNAAASEYWASYIPPGMPEADEDMLRNAGVVFPKSPLESDHLRFNRTPSHHARGACSPTN
ncbi:hypothetical protein [Granulicella sibirica]|uniref:hypothetical protein n=1 Tax=Granulicella sibirica TaxID=2479048 RepID=UPI001008F507|nr:hypothetical protein [Granulicella sibirica]